MKKITFLLAVVFLFSSSIAQQLPTLTHPSQQGEIIQLDKNNVVKTTTKANERWYNYGQTMDVFFSGESVLFANNLFPDSTILFQYADGPGTPWIHALGDVLDVTSQFFNNPMMHNQELALSKHSTYTLDSISMIAIYDRNLVDPNIVDTLVFEVVVNGDLSSWYFAGGNVNANLGADTVSFRGLEYYSANNELDHPAKFVYKLPLDEQVYADSLSNGLHILSIATPDLPTILAGEYVGLAVKFIPGYTWTPHTDFLNDMNRIRFLSFKQQDNSFPLYSKGDYNVSYIVPKDVRYDMAGNWNGMYIPSFAYMGNQPTYSYEHHWILYKITCETECGTVDVNNITKDNSMVLGDAYPNPTAQGNLINIPVSLSSDARLVIRNVIGQEIFVNENLKEGYQVIEINTNDMQSGLYFYTLEMGNETATKKFIVQ